MPTVQSFAGLIQRGSARALRSFAVLGLLSVTLPASAEDQVTDIEGAKEPAKPAGKQAMVREVVRGFYVKANVGSLLFVGPRAARGLQAGTSLSLTVGQDFIDKERSSAAWEVFFHQSLNNGPKYNTQPLDNPNLLIQGDIHTFTGGVAGEYSAYLTRRLGIGARVGGGLGFAPLLMQSDEYQNEVVNDTWGGTLAGVHEGPLPLVFGGPTAEYYTKLSHFSIGVDAVFSYYIGLDFGIDATGYLKYTF